MFVTSQLMVKFAAEALTRIPCPIRFDIHARPSDFWQSTQGQTCHGYINHDIVLGLCSELLKVIICQVFGKKSTLSGIKPGTMSCLP